MTIIQKDLIYIIVTMKVSLWISVWQHQKNVLKKVRIFFIVWPIQKFYTHLIYLTNFTDDFCYFLIVMENKFWKVTQYNEFWV